jgi:hypothetical protein
MPKKKENTNKDSNENSNPVPIQKEPKKAASKPSRKKENPIEEARKSVGGIIAQRDSFVSKIGAKLARKKETANEIIERLEGVVNKQEKDIERLSKNKKFETENSSIIETLKRVIKDCHKATELLKAQSKSEIEVLEGLKLSVNEFTNNSLQEIHKIKIFAAKATPKSAQKEVEKVDNSRYSDILSVNAFEAFNPLVKNANPYTLFKKKRK